MSNLVRKVVAGLAAVSSLAWGETVVATGTVEGANASSPEVSATVRANPLGGKLLSTESLALKRGGTEVEVFNVMKLKGVVADNQAVNVATGNNHLSDGAFAGVAGMPMVIQNTGNNVLIQNATIVNVHLK